MRTTRSALLLAVLLTTPISAIGADAKPTDPTAAAPAPEYRSVFEGYKPFREEAVTNWRTLNEEVGRVGGHVGIMGGAGGHAGHGGAGAKPPAVTTEGGQPPARGAPKAPAAGSAPKAPAAGAHSH